MLDNYFTYNKILYFLCRIRAKSAFKRGKKHLIHLLTKNPKLNYHIDKKTDEEILLQNILPHRKQWKKIGKTNRYRNKYQKINSIDYNTKCIIYTVKYFQKVKPAEPFIIKLNQFISEIQNSINDPDFSFTSPEIYPKLKNKKDLTGKKKNICRPITLYNLKDKIIISQTNKYLSELFDSEFYQYSFAFRPTKNDFRPTHHNCIKEILKYRKSFKGDELFVAECDISKFYDSVSHDIIVSKFNKLVERVKVAKGDVDSRAISIFQCYLDSYNFVRDILPLNENPDYWSTYDIPNGEFGWVKDELVKLNHYTNIDAERIGIPQGGAISGLIANIVLDYTDSVLTKGFDNLFYTRFCDDMIIIHPDLKKCEEAINSYKQALLELKLVPHDFHECLGNDHDSFWKFKSKSPYRWSSNYLNYKYFPWIGFVGYEIHFDGNLRVRKKSLKKETKKQREVINRIERAIRQDRRARKGTILESATNRLIGMAVGRIQMWNHSKIDHELCWTNGFNQLSDNKYLSNQLKHLDRNRNHQVAKLKKEISKYKDTRSTDDEISRPKKKQVFYGKPFSYYFQVIDRRS